MKKYEPPKAFRLDETESIYGVQSDCNDGSSATSCAAGVGAGGACKSDGTNALQGPCVGDGLGDVGVGDPGTPPQG